MAKLVRFPEGVMTEVEWVQAHADRVEPYHESVSFWYNRVKFNRMDGAEQKVYMASLEAKAAKQRYRAWRGESYYEISKSTYDAAIKKVE